MRNDLFRALMAGGAIILCGFGAAEHACAQAISDAPAQTAADAPDIGLADIVVTAQRRQEKAQSVPISIT